MELRKLKIGVVGVGMVGTPLKRYFEEIKGYSRGEDLFLYDIDPQKGYFDDVGRADVIFICVPTPRSPDGAANISVVESALNALLEKPPAPSALKLSPRSLGEAGRSDSSRSGKIVVIKSTVPPGTTESFQEKYPHHQFFFNPEFLTEKQAWEDFLKPDRQIVGFTKNSIGSANVVLSILPKAPFMSPWGLHTYRPIKITATEAEIIKYGGNIYFARKINLANVLASLAEKLEVDYENVRAGMAADFRIGDSHLDVSHGGYRGFGGYCFPKDLDAFIAYLDSRGLESCASFLREDKKFNERLLANQGLTLEDVSVHDHEWIKKKMQSSKIKSQNYNSKSPISKS